MDIKINRPKVHNRFDVFIETPSRGIKKHQVGYAENIVLDAMWTTLCAGGYPFVRIQYGTGTGTLAASRTTLFTYLGYKAATLTERIYANPTSSLRQSIELGLTDNVGAILTEVGVANNSGTLLTHAMLRDMNGNPVSIEKTALDILTIYGTIYAAIDDTHATLKMLSAESNGLIRQILGESGILTYVRAGQCGIVQDFPPSLISEALGQSDTGTWTADVPNKRRTLATPRFGVSASNGNIQELELASVARLALPASGIYAGLDLVDVPVGSGDGIEDEFLLPSRNIDQDSLTVKIDGAAETAFTKAVVRKSYYLLGSKKPVAAAGATSASLSDDGVTLAVGIPGAASPVQLFKYDNGGYEAQEFDIAGLNGVCDMAPDGTALAVGLLASPFVRVYDLVNAVWTARADPADLPTAAPDSVALSDDGLVLMANDNVMPRVYDWAAGAWTTRSSTGLNTTLCYKATLSGNGLFLAYNHNYYQRTIRYWTGAEWTLRYNFAAGSSYTPILLGYDATQVYGYGGANLLVWDGATYISTASAIVFTNAKYIAMSASGNMIAIVYSAYQAYSTRSFEKIGGVWAEVTNLAKVFSYDSGAIAVSDNHEFVYAAGNAQYGNNAVVGIGTPANTLLTFTDPPGLVTAEAVGTGDGSDATWDLDHTPITGSLVVKLDGSTTTAYTLAGSTITFDAAPGAGVVITADYRYACSITADYTVDGIHKTTQRIIDLTFTVQFGEPT